MEGETKEGEMKEGEMKEGQVTDPRLVAVQMLLGWRSDRRVTELH